MANGNNLVRGMLDPMQFYYYNQGNLVNIPRPTEYIDEQEFTADGEPIPIAERQVALEALPEKMNKPIEDANNVAQKLKDAWLKGFSQFMGGDGMLNSKPKDTGGRNKPVKKLKSLKSSEKPGWTMAKGTNFWSVNTDDPYWDTDEGYDEAIALYGESPGWSTKPVQPQKMLNSSRNTVAANLKKYF